MLKNNTFLTSILEGFRLRFGRVFGRFFGPKMHENCKNTFLAKTLKIVVFLRENWYFQGFEDNKYTKTVTKNLEKFDVFGVLDFRGVLDGFWESFGKPKASIFALFCIISSMQNLEGILKGQKIEKKWSTKTIRCTFGTGPAECARPGGRI